MEKSPNGSIMDMPGDNRDLAIEIFEKVKKFMEDELPLKEIDRRVQWETLEAATVPVTEQSETEVDVVSHDVCLDSVSVQQHFISTVVFRCMRQENGHDWELESFSDHVDIGVLDEIGLAESESLQLKYKKEVKISMAENIDIVLMRTINDWSGPDGNVWSLQIEWSGSFLDSRRVLQLMELNSP